jgi:hypothetical protein
MKNWKLDFFIRNQISSREAELTSAKSSVKTAKEKEAKALKEENEYKYGYWFGLRCCHEDSVRAIERELEFLNSELMECGKNGSFPTAL